MTAAERWWAGAVGYEVYLRSFADAHGDGVGDLPGLLGRLEHLAWLGVDIVWITPFYPSPMRDHGYDVADYTGVDPMFGSLPDLDAVIERAHALGLRVVIDLVPNHCSSDHPWFVDALRSPDSPHRDWFIFRDPAPDGGPPNNWVSHFGGPAWTLDEASGQYWCHLFLPEQPDLNWRNPAVADAFDEILRFWLERGVDGFRIDVAHALHKHPDLPDLPEDGGFLQHVHDVDQPEVLDVYRRWRLLVEPYDALLLGEVYLLEPERLERYVAADDGLHAAFWFTPLIVVGWDPAAVKRHLQALTPEVTPRISWVQGSHDRKRAASRYGGGALGRRRALAVATAQLCLPGLPFVYQGEELAMTDGEVPAGRTQDPLALGLGDPEWSRDGCRTPMLWEPEPGWGFTSGDPWLPFGERSTAETVAHQREDPDSSLHRYRALIAVRRTSADLRGGAPAEWLDAPAEVLAYRRGATLVVANCADETVRIRLERPVRVVFATERTREDATERGWLEVAPLAGLVCEQEP